MDGTFSRVGVRALDISGGGCSAVIKAVRAGGECVVEMDTGDSDILC